eukprot:CAMPEP_0117649264 /NCGR_PEP_ID=MMETSP0804-20121206/873_1 /TAXON_ID=1074897 /ORGANISM="Tetraselmis astigmatica, Strain CCMP880" /LENGTH=113 /DNA_ID=CAMNT_0005454977 /DNA_START=1165 /DNA_END=1503 /DNA_ORIENTATION=-
MKSSPPTALGSSELPLSRSPSQPWTCVFEPAGLASLGPSRNTAATSQVTTASSIVFGDPSDRDWQRLTSVCSTCRIIMLKCFAAVRTTWGWGASGLRVRMTPTAFTNIVTSSD